MDRNRKCALRTPRFLRNSVAERRRRVWPSGPRAGDMSTLLAASAGGRNRGVSSLPRARPHCLLPHNYRMPLRAARGAVPHTLYTMVLLCWFLPTRAILISGLVRTCLNTFLSSPKSIKLNRDTGGPCGFYEVLSNRKRMLSCPSPQRLLAYQGSCPRSP